MRKGSFLVAALALASAGLLLGPQNAEAFGRRGHRPFVGGGFYVRPYFGPYYGFGFGYSPLFAPYGGYPGFYYGNGFGYGYGPRAAADTLAVARMTGYGALDLEAKPGNAELWVDGKYTGEAKDFDGYPGYLWLEKGAHRLALYKGGYRTFDEEVEVERGVIKQLKVRLEKGESQRPGERPKGEAAKGDHGV